jgi:selenocysteine lyase/cysteine desulfurase
VLSRKDGTTEQRYHQLADSGIDAAYREGNLRLSVHLFNTMKQVDQALDALHAPIRES